MDPRAAWEACGQPRGESGIQNIRKRGYALRQKTEKSAAEHQEEAATPRIPNASNQRRGEDENYELRSRSSESSGAASSHASSEPKKPYRLSSAQVAKQRAADHTLKAAYAAARAECTAEYERLFATGKTGRGGESAKSIVARFNATLPAGCKLLTPAVLYQSIQNGNCGQKPGRPGKAPALSKTFVEGVADYAQAECF